MRKVPLQVYSSLMLEQSLIQFSVEVTEPFSSFPEFSKAFTNLEVSSGILYRKIEWLQKLKHKFWLKDLLQVHPTV